MKFGCPLILLLLVGNAALAEGPANQSFGLHRCVPPEPCPQIAEGPVNQLTFSLSSPALGLITGPSGNQYRGWPNGPSVVELLVTSPSGRRTGVDPIRHVSYSDIPRSYYAEEGLDNDETGEPDLHPMKTLSISVPAVGTYTVRVTGTGKGTYDLEVSRVGVHGDYQDNNSVDQVSITPGETHLYRVNYSTASSVPLRLQRVANH